MITNLFPTKIVEKIVPEHVYDTTKHTLDLVLANLLYTEQIHKTGGMLTSDEGVKNTNNFIDRYNLSELNVEVLDTATQYLSAMNIAPMEDLKIFMSWLTKIGPGNTSSKHCHDPSTLVGVYYCSSETNQGKLRLFNSLPKEFQTHQYVDIEIEPGKLVLFPGWLYHEVQENQSNTVRHSIAINIQIYESENK